MFNRLIFFVVIVLFSCDKQSNPFIGDNSVSYIENMSNESRDILVLDDITFDIFDCSVLLDENICNEDMWCGYNGSECINTSNDLLVVANQYQEGLIVYNINSSETGINLDKIYFNNNFEEINESSLENDLEIRQLAYDENNNLLYMLDKFEYIYNIWLPTILDQTTDNFDIEGGCYDSDGNEDGIWDPKQLNIFTQNEKLHSTQLIMDEISPGSYEIIYLLKYNANITSAGNIPGPTTPGLTSMSNLGSYKFVSSPDAFGESLACNATFIATESHLDIGPLFDYNVSDIFKNDNKLIISNSYDSYVFKNDLEQIVNIDYYEEDLDDGCSLPENSISFTPSGELLYNVNENVSYFEFNVINTDLSDKYSEVSSSPYYQYPSSSFEGFIENYSDFSVSISGNKIIGYKAASGSNIPPACGTLIDLDLDPNDNAELIIDNKYSISIYDYSSPSGFIDFNSTIKTSLKPKAIYSNGSYLIAGLDDDGCYITLLGQSTKEMIKFGCGNFTVNDIIYDSENSKLLLSCGNDGVLVYSWSGSGVPLFDYHIVSSHSYKSRYYRDNNNNSYVIIATKYGVEIYNL